MTNEDESGESVMHVGVDFDCGIEHLVSFQDEPSRIRTYFFEFVEISFTLKIPDFGHTGQRKRFHRLPVFNETTFISRDYAVIPVTVL